MVAIIAMVGGLGSGYCVGTYKRLLVEKTARQFLLMARMPGSWRSSSSVPTSCMIDPNNQGFLLATTEADPETGRIADGPSSGTSSASRWSSRAR